MKTRLHQTIRDETVEPTKTHDIFLLSDDWQRWKETSKAQTELPWMLKALADA